MAQSVLILYGNDVVHRFVPTSAVAIRIDDAENVLKPFVDDNPGQVRWKSRNSLTDGMEPTGRSQRPYPSSSSLPKCSSSLALNSSGVKEYSCVPRTCTA